MRGGGGEDHEEREMKMRRETSAARRPRRSLPVLYRSLQLLLPVKRHRGEPGHTQISTADRTHARAGPTHGTHNRFKASNTNTSGSGQRAPATGGARTHTHMLLQRNYTCTNSKTPGDTVCRYLVSVSRDSRTRPSLCSFPRVDRKSTLPACRRPGPGAPWCVDLQVASDRQLPDLTLPYFGAFWGELAFSAFSLDHTWYRPARDPRHPQSRDPSPTPYFTIHIKHMHLSRTPPKPQMSKQTPRAPQR